MSNPTAANAAPKTSARPPAPQQQQVALHPILFGIYPVIHLFAESYGHFEWSVIWRPLAVCVVLTALAWWALTRWLGDPVRAALAMFPLWLAFYSQRVLGEVWKAKGYIFAPDQWVPLETAAHAALWAVAIALAWLFARVGKSRNVWNYGFNVFAMILIVFPFFHIYSRSVEAEKAREVVEPAADAILNDLPKASPAAASKSKPDIYFIVVDSYGRADILQEFYHFDNSEFLNFLKEKDFTIVDRASSNYGHTPLSIGSTMNLEYVTTMAGGQDVPWLTDWRYYREFFERGRLIRFLKQQGYSIATVSSQYGLVDYPNADVYRTRWWFLNRFETFLLEMTPVPWLAHKLGWALLYNIHREEMLFNINHITDLAAVPGPKFVYAHIFAPHPPFVVGAHGEPKTPHYNYSWVGSNAVFDLFDLPDTSQEQYRQDFIAQTQFVNSRMEQIIPAILERSATPPIIVLQSDHGPASAEWVRDPNDPSIRERFSVLNAVHLPGGDSSKFYSGMSLVNTFRVVLNQAFGTGLPMLEDRSYYVAFTQPYVYKELAAGGQASGTLAKGPGQE